jgi:hemolysin activation/secretion protein
LFRDRVRALRVGAGFDAVDGLRGINLIELEASQGLTGGATEQGDPLASRAGAPPDFQKFTYYVARLQSLAPRWSLLLAASGQSTNSPLLSAEQFSFGGSDFGRGYNASDLTGDAGNAAKLELRFADAGSGWLRDYTVYLFADAGQVQRSGTSAGDDHASSGGLGVRFNTTNGLSGFAEYSKPTDHDIPASSNRDARLFVGVSYAF